MRTVKTLLWLALISISVKLSAQRFYAVTSDSLVKVNLTSAGCISTLVSVCPGADFFSIAIYKDTLYYLNSHQLSRGILRGTQLTNCQNVATLPFAFTSLTVDSNGILYFAQDSFLYKLDVKIGIAVSLGILPYQSAGDLILFKGLLYMASTQGIVLVNINTPASSELIIPSTDVIYGLASLSIDCTANKVYAFSSNSADVTNIIELDLENKNMKGVVCTMPYVALDAASDVEGGNFADIPLNGIKVNAVCNEAPKASIDLLLEPGITIYNYSFDGGPFTAKTSFTTVSPGLHTISIITPGTSCRIDTSVTVPAYDINKPFITAFKKEVNCTEGGKIWFTAPADTTIYSVLFQTDTFAITNVFAPLVGGDYWFIFIDQNDCRIDSQSLHLNTAIVCDTIYFPNAFTPNRDNVNEVFKGSDNYSIKSYQLTVFDRWGKVTFTSQTLNKGWDGTRNGKEQPTGIYAWIAVYTTAGGEQKKQKGIVALLR